MKFVRDLPEVEYNINKHADSTKEIRAELRQNEGLWAIVNEGLVDPVTAKTRNTRWREVAKRYAAEGVYEVAQRTRTVNGVKRTNIYMRYMGKQT